MTKHQRKKTHCLLIERGNVRGLPTSENGFRIEYIAPNGAQIMWTGATYQEAIATARWIAGDELPIADLAGGAR